MVFLSLSGFLELPITDYYEQHTQAIFTPEYRIQMVQTLD